MEKDPNNATTVPWPELRAHRDKAEHVPKS
jgi:hypothetical protein